MSFWKNLEITTKSFLEEDIISTLPDGYFIKTSLLCSEDKPLVQRLIHDFHELGDIKTFLNDSNYKTYLKFGTCCAILYNNDCDAIGLVLTIMLPILSYQDIITQKNGYTSYYCVKPIYRGLGYGKILLQSIIKFGHSKDIGIRKGYHLFCVDPYPVLKIKQWLLDLGKISVNNVIYNKENVLSLKFSYEYWKNEQNKYRMVFSPELIDWEKWISSFDTYMIADKYIFSLEYEYVIYKGFKFKIALILLGSGKDIPQLLKDAIQIAKREGARILYVYEIGNFNANLLNSAGFDEGNANINLALYNYSTHQETKDIMVPFI